ncbi:hypothetical protein AruPA_15485 [Acidiphilium sp. PA]|uniref:type ISP restriction/modification enzyme n=1 Tax=Acidiphilium sp. PA TaxID=2871705 RepID=UPI0022447F41|nr:type ISP restriction/modification enzyme [Acidiphilium sp. PA]MCW8308441.1 hypothetical protein [Acidiphilium sp. PA]
MEKRGGSLMDYSKSALEHRIKVYLDPKQPMEVVRRIAPGLADDRARFNAVDARDDAKSEFFRTEKIKRYWVRAFDHCWAYTTLIRPIWNEPRPMLQRILADAEGFVISRPSAVADPDGFPSCWSSTLGDNDGLRGHSYFFPIVENLSGAPRANLSALAVGYLAAMVPADGGLSSGGPEVASADVEPWIASAAPRDDGEVLEREQAVRATAAGARAVWMHALAVMYAPAYLAENAGGIRQGWPRVPLPSDAGLLRRSAGLGEVLAALLDPDCPVEGVTRGVIRPELVSIGVPHGVGFGVTAGWGNRTDKGITMPGKGRSVVREYAPGEAATAAVGGVLGARTRDVYLNEGSYWANIPEAVWDLHIGGYQVLKKWLSYREYSIIGRDLAAGEVRHVMETARRLAAILLLGPALDASFRDCAAAHRALG